MNANIKSALQNGRVVRAGEIEFKDGLGRFLKLTRFNAFTGEELASLIEKFGADACVGFSASDEMVARREENIAADRAAYDARLAASAPRRQRDTDGDGFAAGLANCGGF